MTSRAAQAFAIGLLVTLLFGKAAAAQTSFDASGGGSVLPGNDNRTCDGSIEGAIRTIRSVDAPSFGLVAHWKFDEATGVNPVDHTGNGNDGAWNYGAAASMVGVIGTALNMSDSTGFDVPNGISTLGNLEDLTVSFWASFDEMSGYENIFHAGGITRIDNSSSDHNDFEFNAFSWDTADGKWESNDGFSNIGKWTHYAVTYSYNDPAGTKPRMYVNGEIRSVSTTNTPSGGFAISTEGTVVFGRSDTGNSASGFSGGIDDFRIYNRVLSGEEIQGLVAARTQVCTDKLGSYQWTDWGK